MPNTAKNSMPSAHFIPGCNPYVDIIVAATGRMSPVINVIKVIDKKDNLISFLSLILHKMICKAGAINVKMSETRKNIII
jgi:hypothetical protein